MQRIEKTRKKMENKWIKRNLKGKKKKIIIQTNKNRKHDVGEVNN